MMKFPFFFTTVSLALLLKLVFSPSLPVEASLQQIEQQPQFENGQTLLAQRRSRLRFRVPRVRPSGNLESGAARGQCNSDNQPINLTPLLPLTRSDGKVQVYPASTVSDHPKLFVHIPQLTAQEAQAKFLVLNQTGSEIIYEETFAVSGTPGVVEFSIPPNTTALEVGKTYKWSVEVVCDPNDSDSSGNLAVEGVIQRVEASANLVDIEKVAQSDRPLAYAEADIWYDAVATLAKLRQDQPNNPTFVEDWSDLLKSVNLDPIADAPLVPCCKPKNE